MEDDDQVVEIEDQQEEASALEMEYTQAQRLQELATNVLREEAFGIDGIQRTISRTTTGVARLEVSHSCAILFRFVTSTATRSFVLFCRYCRGNSNWNTDTKRLEYLLGPWHLYSHLRQAHSRALMSENFPDPSWVSFKYYFLIQQCAYEIDNTADAGELGLVMKQIELSELAFPVLDAAHPNVVLGMDLKWRIVECSACKFRGSTGVLSHFRKAHGPIEMEAAYNLCSSQDSRVVDGFQIWLQDQLKVWDEDSDQLPADALNVRGGEKSLSHQARLQKRKRTE